MAHAAHTDAHHDDEHHGHHIIPFSLLAKVFGALVFLTGLTYVTAVYIPLGPLEVPIAILIACTKAGLVVFIFMGLKWDNKVNLLAFSICTIIVLVFISITLLDTEYRGDFGNVDELPLDDRQRIEQAIRDREEALNNPAAAAVDTAATETALADTTTAAP
ncbi:MAG: cytochrome C oxidase subunit IV family protein [Bacteroidota bacterium]